MIKFSRIYFALTITIFLIEVIIAIYVKDSIIRPYGGDVLAAVLVYCFLKSFLNIKISEAALASLVISYLVELSQYTQLIYYIGLQENRLARIVLGSSFEWFDMLAYTIGIIAVLIVEEIIKKGRENVNFR